MLRTSPDSPKLAIAALPNEVFLIEGSYQSMHADKIQLELGKQVYRQHFYTKGKRIF
jgi:hypothetical protein